MIEECLDQLVLGRFFKALQLTRGPCSMRAHQRVGIEKQFGEIGRRCRLTLEQRPHRTDTTQRIVGRMQVVSQLIVGLRIWAAR